tara:strand:+ start:896 stop:1669 length:774 start_codon:yes stop_codon:yes gene_type:complete
MNNNKLIVYGGQAFRHSKHEIGIVSKKTNAKIVPLQWSNSSLVISGNPNTGCVESRCLNARHSLIPCQKNTKHTCEYDGKLHVMTFRKNIFLYTRSNPFPKGGRHVQVAIKEKGKVFSKFRQLIFTNYTQNQYNNIYFFLAYQYNKMMIGIFPAVINYKGAIWCSTSRDGIIWSKPLSIFESVVMNEVRISDWPVDLQVFNSNLQVTLQLTLQHNVKIEFHNDFFQTLCDVQPPTEVCTYKLINIDMNNPCKSMIIV